MEEENTTHQTNAKSYWPLIVLILVSVLVGLTLGWGLDGTSLQMMHFFMGFFLCVFALLKLFHPSGFADGFQMYDLLAKRSRLYAYIYPILELILGLLYFSFLVPYLVYILTILLLGFGAFGVIRALREGLDVHCACMGSILDVPLSTVTLTEDIGMVVMALIMLYLKIVA